MPQYIYDSLCQAVVLQHERHVIKMLDIIQLSQELISDQKCYTQGLPFATVTMMTSMSQEK